MDENGCSCQDHHRLYGHGGLRLAITASYYRHVHPVRPEESEIHLIFSYGYLTGPGGVSHWPRWGISLAQVTVSISLTQVTVSISLTQVAVSISLAQVTVSISLTRVAVSISLTRVTVSISLTRVTDLGDSGFLLNNESHYLDCLEHSSPALQLSSVGFPIPKSRPRLQVIIEARSSDHRQLIRRELIRRHFILTSYVKKTKCQFQ